MAAYLRKRISVYTVMLGATAQVYLFAILIMPLSHTCSLGQTPSDGRKFDDADHCHTVAGICMTFRSTIKRDGRAGGNMSGHSLCTACLYSTISKTFALISSALFKTSSPKNHVQALPHLNFVNKFEWLCSNHLRAPPPTSLLNKNAER